MEIKPDDPNLAVTRAMNAHIVDETLRYLLNVVQIALCLIGGYLIASASGLFGEARWINDLLAKPNQALIGILCAAAGSAIWTCSDRG